MLDAETALAKIGDAMQQHRMDVAGLELATAHAQLVNFRTWMTRALLEVQAETLEWAAVQSLTGLAAEMAQDTRAEIAKLGRRDA